MSHQEQVQMQTIKEAYKNVENWKPQAPVPNKWSGKKECPIMPNNQLTVVQVGTENHPMYCPFGVSRWVPGARGTYKTVTAGDGVEWAYQAQQDSAFERRNPGGKLNVQITMHEHDQPGTQGYYLYNFIMGLYKNCIDGLVNGVPDYNDLDENGQPKIVQPTTLPGAANNKEQLKNMFEMCLQPPIRQEGSYPPNLKMKVRYGVMGGTLKLGADVLDYAREGAARYTPVSPAQQLQLFKPKSRGVFMFKINPLQFVKPTEINMTIDVVKVIFIRKESVFQTAQFRMNDDEDDEGGKNSNGEQNVAAITMDTSE